MTKNTKKIAQKYKTIELVQIYFKRFNKITIITGEPAENDNSMESYRNTVLHSQNILIGVLCGSTRIIPQVYKQVYQNIHAFFCYFQFFPPGKWIRIHADPDPQPGSLPRSGARDSGFFSPAAILGPPPEPTRRFRVTWAAIPADS